MNHVTSISLGVLATVTASMFGLVIVPDWQFEEMQPVEVQQPDGTVAVYPQPYDDWQEEPGREVYRSMGCMYCHSQQVRPEGFGADLDRAWGMRRSVPRDYVLQDPPYLGTMRTGPDLANIGQRQPSEQWHHTHLYDPQITSEGSVMPPFRFLYDTVYDVEPQATTSRPVFRLPDDYAGRPAWIIPKKEAIDLVKYLLALKQPFSQEAVQ